MPSQSPYEMSRLRRVKAPLPAATALVAAVVGLAAGLARGAPAAAPGGGQGSAADPLQVPGPSAWHLLNNDAPFGCGPGEANRDVGATYWASESGYLHLRMCTAGAPGWSPAPPSWEDARYKWWIDAGGVRGMLLLEDFPSNARGLADTANGRGELTLIDDLNGSGLFSDDWALRNPPEYVANFPGSPFWRRVEAATTGPGQSGVARDIGFRLGAAACGPVVDTYVRLALFHNPSTATLRWATDAENRNLDVRGACDSGPGAQRVDLVGVSPSATATRGPVEPSPTPSATPPVVVPTATASATASPKPTATSSATATERPTPTTTATATLRPPAATETPTPTVRPPSATPSPGASPSPSPTASATVAPPVASDTPTASATATSAATSTTAASATPSATATLTQGPPTATATVTPATATPTPTPSPFVAASPTPTATATSAPAKPTATPVPPSATSTASATASAGGTPPAAGGLNVCALALVGGQTLPFPDPATARIVLLTAQGAPAKPPLSLPLQPDGCARFRSLEAGLYRATMVVPPGWVPVSGTAMSQTVIVNSAPPPSQAIFRFQPGSCPPPCPGGGVPTPPGPPTVAPIGPPAVPSPTPYPDSPARPNVGALAMLPILNFLGNDPVCRTWVEVQNIGDRPAKAIFIAWGPPGFCPPQCAGPLKVECSGLLAPGSAWNFLGAQVPGGAKSGVVVSANVSSIGDDIFADALCESLYFGAVGDCDAYRRFLLAYTTNGRWQGFDFGAYPRQPLAVEVLRDCPGDLRPNVRVTSSYAGIAGEYLGRWDPVYGGFAFYAPSLFAARAGFTSFLYIQNAGVECTSVEIWFKAQDDCLRARICDILTLAPGETYQLDAGSCMPPDWLGGAWIRATQPMAVAIDHIGNDVLMTYTGLPSELRFTFEGEAVFTTGSPIAFGPLVYSEYQGWDSAVIVQNLSGTTAAKVKVYFLDRSGGIVTTLADWVCARGTQTFYLPVIAALPGHWIGSVRVESQDWFSPGGPAIGAPNIHAVAELLRYADVARTDVQEAIAYNFLSEDLAFDWQVGRGAGGTASGVGRLGIPSFVKDRTGTGVTSEIAIANVVPKPGFTNFALYIHDQNGLLDYLCESLGSGQVEYINLASWGFINPGFRGSAVVSATFWEHEVFDRSGGFTRNLVGLAAVKVERTGTRLGAPIPGDESAGNIGFPIPGPFPFAGPAAPRCGGGGPGPAPPPPPPIP